MKRFSFFLILFSSLLFFSCQEDSSNEFQEEIKPEGSIVLSNYEIELEREGSATIEISYDIKGSTVNPGDFILLTADDKTPKFVSISLSEKSGTNKVKLTLKDMRSSGSREKYEEEVYVVHSPSGIRSDLPFLACSAGYIPVVYLKTGVAQGNINKDNWVAGKIEIDGGDEFPDLGEMACEVKGRGNSTWSWEKKPYAIRLESKQEVLGMPKHKRWCLIANYMDRTHLRNRVAYYISEHTGLAYTTRNRFVELYFNGSYQGLYLLTEQIKVDKNRINIKELSPTDNDDESITGGYLLEFDTNYDEVKRFHSSSTSIPVNLKYPDADEITDTQYAYIRTYLNNVDRAIYLLKSGKGKPEAVYELLDRDSMIDFWIVFEVMANHEVLHPKSVYFHKDRGGKLTAGPVWDFDYATLIQRTSTTWINYDLSWEYNEFAWFERNWWNSLFLYDPEFSSDVKKRWNELYGFLSTVPEFIKTEKAYISKSVQRNNQRWTSIHGTSNPNGDETLTFESAVDLLTKVYTSRIEWMNTQINKW